LTLNISRNLSEAFRIDQLLALKKSKSIILKKKIFSNFETD